MFESSIPEHQGRNQRRRPEYAIAVNTGTSAPQLALLAAGVGLGEEDAITLRTKVKYKLKSPICASP